MLFIICLLILPSCSPYSQNEMDNFAKCLTDSGAVMYGAFWCTHCLNIKKEFGSSFKYVAYVECDSNGPNQQAAFCLQKNVTVYSIWIFSDGSRLLGEPSLEALSNKTGCNLSERNN